MSTAQCQQLNVYVCQRSSHSVYVNKHEPDCLGGLGGLGGLVSGRAYILALGGLGDSVSSRVKLFT